jgi:hypothetical protein
MTVAAIALVYRFAAADRRGLPGRGGWTDYLLANLVLLSVVLHLDVAMHPKPWIIVHEHDIFHYYLGSKYSREVGYLDLYGCVTVAEAENLDGQIGRYRVRRMTDYRLVENHELLAQAERYRARFTPERWEEFKGDVAVFRAGLGGEERWRIVLRDNGYNATPAWNMIARLITNLIPVQWGPGMLLLTLFDTALLLLMFVAIYRCFGRRAALLAAVFLGSLVTMADGTIRGAFLRLDWFVMLVLATCALRRGRYKSAGALAAGATMVRIFPLLFVFGLGAKAVWGILAERRLDRRYLQFFAVFLLVALLLFTASLVAGGGLERWESFWTKIQLHDTQMSALRLGFKTLFLAAPSQWIDDWPARPAGRSQRFDELRWLWIPLQFLVLACSFLAVRRLDDFEAFALGWVLVYFLAAPTFYYQVVLLLPALIFLRNLGDRLRAHGMALLFGFSGVGYLLWIRQNLDQGLHGLAWRRFEYSVSVSLAALLLVVALYLLGFSLYRALTRTGPYASRDAAASGS